MKESYANKVKGLFTLNERVILSGQWKEGFLALGMVGAYNVGSIQLTNPLDPIVTNQAHELIYSKHRHHKHYEQPWTASAGDRVGTFALGSTVVMALEASQIHWLVQPGEKVKMGQPIGYIGDIEDEEAILMEYQEMMEEMSLDPDETEIHVAEAVSEMMDVAAIESLVSKEVQEEVNKIEEINDFNMTNDSNELRDEATPIEPPTTEIVEITTIPVEETTVSEHTAEITASKIVEKRMFDEWGVKRGRREEGYW